MNAEKIVGVLDLVNEIDLTLRRISAKLTDAERTVTGVAFDQLRDLRQVVDVCGRSVRATREKIGASVE